MFTYLVTFFAIPIYTLFEGADSLYDISKVHNIANILDL